MMHHSSNENVSAFLAIYDEMRLEPEGARLWMGFFEECRHSWEFGKQPEGALQPRMIRVRLILSECRDTVFVYGREMAERVWSACIYPRRAASSARAAMRMSS